MADGFVAVGLTDHNVVECPSVINTVYVANGYDVFPPLIDVIVKHC
jgi:hypothetical protein